MGNTHTKITTVFVPWEFKFSAESRDTLSDTLEPLLTRKPYNFGRRLTQQILSKLK